MSPWIAPFAHTLPACGPGEHVPSQMLYHATRRETRRWPRRHGSLDGTAGRAAAARAGVLARRRCVRSRAGWRGAHMTAPVAEGTLLWGPSPELMRTSTMTRYMVWLSDHRQLRF